MFEQSTCMVKSTFARYQNKSLKNREAILDMYLRVHGPTIVFDFTFETKLIP